MTRALPDIAATNREVLPPLVWGEPIRIHCVPACVAAGFADRLVLLVGPPIAWTAMFAPLHGALARARGVA